LYGNLRDSTKRGEALQSPFRSRGRTFKRASFNSGEIAALTKTIRSRFDHEVGGTVEGCIILEKHVVIPPDLAERRRGVYEYVVDVPPAAMKPAATRSAEPQPRRTAPERGSFTRSTPDERGGVVRRLPSR
jgi:hypothetical protein